MAEKHTQEKKHTGNLLGIISSKIPNKKFQNEALNGVQNEVRRAEGRGQKLQDLLGIILPKIPSKNWVFFLTPV